MAEGICIGNYGAAETAERDHLVTTIETVGIGDPTADASDPDVCAIEEWKAVPPAPGATHARTCQVSNCGRVLECRTT